MNVAIGRLREMREQWKQRRQSKLERPISLAEELAFDAGWDAALRAAAECESDGAASAEPSGEPEPDGEAIWDFVDDGSLMIECTEDWKGVEMKMSAEVHRRIMDAIRVASRAAAPVSEPLLDVLETVTDALDDLKEAVRKANKMNGPEYMGLGYRVVKAIDLGRNRIALARRTPEATDG